MLVATDEYFSAYAYVPLLCCAMVFSSFSTFMGSSFLVFKKSRLSFITSMIGAITNIILNFILIRKYEIYGAAVATFASYFIVFIIRAIMSKKLVDFNMYPVQTVVGTAIIVLQTVCTYFEPKYLFVINIVAVVATVAIYFKTFYSVISKVMKSFLSKRKSK